MEKITKIKSIGPTVIEFDNPKDMKDFIDWAEGKYVEGLSPTPEQKNRMKELIKNHVPCKRRITE